MTRAGRGLPKIALNRDSDEISSSHGPVQPSMSFRAASRKADRSRSPRSAAAATRAWRRHSSAKPGCLVSGTQSSNGPEARLAERRAPLANPSGA